MHPPRLGTINILTDKANYIIHFESYSLLSNIENSNARLRYIIADMDLAKLIRVNVLLILHPNSNLPPRKIARIKKEKDIAYI